MILTVIDMSPAVYAGSFNRHSMIPLDVVQTADGYRERYIPTGGVSQLMNILAQLMGHSDIAMVADRIPAIKKDMFANYKSNRPHSEPIMIAKDVAEYIMTDCGFTIHYRDGYEADDIIANIVRANHDKYDTIFVCTADSDLYILVDDKVSIIPTSTQAKTVTRDTYETSIKSGKYVRYNSVVFNKFLVGDPGKNIPALSKADQDYIISRIIHNDRSWEYLGNWMYVRELFRRNFPQYFDRLQLFYPLPIDEPWEITTEGDTQRIKEWAYLVGNRKIPGREGDLSKQLSELAARQLYLEN